MKFSFSLFFFFFVIIYKTVYEGRVLIYLRNISFVAKNFNFLFFLGWKKKI